MGSVQLYDNKTVSILLIAASVVLLVNGLYNIEQFSARYGVSGLASALLQDSASNSSIFQLLQPTATQFSASYQAILESFFESIIALLMFTLSFSLFMISPERYESYMSRYVPAHLTLTFVYIGLVFMTHLTLPDTTFFSDNLYMAYVAVGVILIFDLYLEYSRHKPDPFSKSSGLDIDPSTPYSNLLKLRDMFFGDLVGEVGIVDKHFNSAAMENLTRLIGSSNNIKSLSVLTSSEMLDSKFGSDYLDLKKEFKNNEISFEVKVMRDEDAVSQHERFLFDDMIAYKIPPLNIINKKSEHIVKIERSDAIRRFQYLHQNSSKYENYILGLSKK